MSLHIAFSFFVILYVDTALPSECGCLLHLPVNAELQVSCFFLLLTRVDAPFTEYATLCSLEPQCLMMERKDVVFAKFLQNFIITTTTTTTTTTTATTTTTTVTTFLSGVCSVKRTMNYPRKSLVLVCLINTVKFISKRSKE